MKINIKGVTILIIDNSMAFTGAFKCALNEAELLSGEHRFVFVLPAKSSLHRVVQEKGFASYPVNMVEIRKSLSILLQYFFCAIK